METLLEEIKLSSPRTNVEILGINRMDQSSNNALVTNVRTLPWLQDTAEASQWASWGAAWRDVRIVSSRMELASVFNLTPNDLGDPAHRETLKQMLLDAVAASQVDVDEDGLRDDWEAAYLGELAPNSGSENDPDGDGFNNFTEFAFGSHPRLSGSIPQTELLTLTDEEGVTYPVLAFWRRAGSDLRYECERSPDLMSWATGEASGLSMIQRPAYNGQGTSLGLCTSSIPYAGQSRDHLRVRVER